MPLHAGFAAAISISQDALQQIIHLEYINDTFPTEYKNSFTVANNIIQPNFTFNVEVYFFLAEPL
jgi:hypothetical protein